MNSQVRLRLLPKARCLFDEPIKVKVEGLRSRQAVTMRARLTDEKGVVFSSSATYRADGSGEVDLHRDPSLGGTYVGVEPMGLLWSMRPDTMYKKFQKATSLKPQLVNFSVHEEEGRILAEETNERVLMGDGVSRVPVKEGRISGVLFTPPGGGLFPAVLDILTFRSETRASLLASKGFVVLAISLVEGEFESLEHYPRFHLDHFKEAIDFLKQQPKVDSKGVGMIAKSKGADIALSLAAFVPGSKAAVCINGCSANAGIPLYYKKQQILSPLPYDYSKLITTESGTNIVKYILEDPLAETNKGSLIPIEQAKTHLLLAAGEDDHNFDSKRYMDQMVERLKHHGKENFESVSYPGAGHLLQPPYESFCPSCAHGIFPFIAS